MPNRSILSKTIALTILLLCQACASPEETPCPPNIVFILIDDMGWRDLGYTGSDYYESPNIDALAASGLVFNQAYSNAPNCAPTRAALLSGQYAPRHGVYTVGTPERGESRYRQLIPIANNTSLDTSVVTIAESLKEAGYVTGHFGKWHLGNGPHNPKNQGFDTSVQGWWGQGRGHFMPDDMDAAPHSPDAVPGTYMADYLTGQANAFIEENQDRPFFLYLSHYGVHTPIQAKPSYTARFEEKAKGDVHKEPVYAAMIQSIDESVGRVLEQLDTFGLAENTMVVFISDNGGYGPITSMSPLRGAKGMLYEGGIRVPMIVRWPGVTVAGATTDVPVITTDFYPTFLEAAGASQPAGQVLDGVSLKPLLEGGNELNRAAIYWHFPAYLEAYRNQKTPWRTTPAGAMRQGRYKFIEFFGEEQVELYDLVDDPGEQHNLVDEMPEQVNLMKQAMQNWRMETDAPVPDQPNPAFQPEAYAKALKGESL